MVDGDAAQTRWAILVGINFYGDRSHLKGCVRDVKSMEDYLRKGGNTVNINTFTATAPPDSRSQPLEVPESWPTFKNVVSGIMDITEKASAGDFVYIHYSGHGTRKETTPLLYEDVGDLALVLLSDNGNEITYLFGLKLAELLKEMVEKGLLVTLVLDCCFSGSLVRNGKDKYDGIRAIPYEPAVEAAHPPTLRTSIGYQRGSGNWRNAQILHKWLVDPKGYTNLLACGVNEKAGELEISKTKEFHGALSYFLSRALRSKNGADLSHESLYNEIRMKFNVVRPQQTPRRHGNRNLSFFGKPVSEASTTLVSIFLNQDRDLYLDAGKAHGVCRGDKYAVRPFDTTARPGGVTEFSALVEVQAVYNLTSKLGGADRERVKGWVENGWKAKLLKPLRKFRVRLTVKRDRNSDTNDRNDYQSQWMPAAQQFPSLQLLAGSEEGDDCLFSITRNERNEYEILNESQQEVSGSPIPCDVAGSVDSVMELLDRMVTFSFVKELRNEVPREEFEKSFTIFLKDAKGNTYKPDDLVETTHGSRLTLKMHNIKEQTLYIHVLDLKPFWRIEEFMLAAGGGSFAELPPKTLAQEGRPELSGEKQIRFKMEVPELAEGHGQQTCEDTIKVFITSKSTSFKGLSLPKHATEARKLSAPTRCGSNPLSDGDWTVRNFVVRTTRAP